MELRAVSIPDGLPRPFSHDEFLARMKRDWKFQSQTGFPGHLALTKFCSSLGPRNVSISDGLPRPFSPNLILLFLNAAAWVSTPDGLPSHFTHLITTTFSVSSVFLSP